MGNKLYCDRIFDVRVNNYFFQVDLVMVGIENYLMFFIIWCYKNSSCAHQVL